MFIVMRLIDFEDYKIVVTPEAMLIKPIRELYRKDKTRVKDFSTSRCHTFISWLIQEAHICTSQILRNVQKRS